MSLRLDWEKKLSDRAECGRALKRLLGVSFEPGGNGRSLPMWKWILSMLNHQNRRDVYGMMIQEMRLFALATDLRIVDEYDRKERKKFAELLRKCKTEADYGGIRFELQLMARFIKQNVIFKKSESPDFQILHE